MPDYREHESSELKELKSISLNTNVVSGLAEQYFEVFKDRIEFGVAELTSHAKSIASLLRLILAALVAIAVILIVK